jgi:hypothetical protein
MDCRVCSDLELHGALGLLLHDHGPSRDLVAMGHVEDPKLHQIAGAELRVNGYVEEGEIAGSVPQLQADTDRSDIAQLQWCLLADQLALVPWLFVLAFHRRLQSGLRWCSTVR